jgi:hypothetical protein
VAGKVVALCPVIAMFMILHDLVQRSLPILGHNCFSQMGRSPSPSQN